MSLLDFLVYIDAHLALQIAIQVACMIATALLTLAPFIARLEPRLAFLKRPWLFLAVIAFSLFFCRYPGFFAPRYLSADEAQVIAQAITYETHPIPWRDIDGTTAGPINSYVLLWCLPFGIQPNYVTSRILELSCLLGMFIFLYLAARRVAGDLAARLAILPAFLFIAWTADWDFIHYSSEEVSLFLLSWALYLVIKLRRAPGTAFSAVQLGVILGLLPFAKLQSVLLGVLLGLTAIWFLFTTRHGSRHAARTRINLLIAAALVPSVVILSIVAQAGALSDFWQSYIRMASVNGVVYGTFLEQLQARATGLAWILDPRREVALPLDLALASTILIGLHILLGKQKLTRSSRFWLAWAVLFSLVTVATITFNGRLYNHYLFFLLPASTFLIAVNFRLVGLSGPAPRISVTTAPLLLATVLTSPFITADLLFPHWNYLHPSLLGALLAWFVGLAFVLTLGCSLAQTALIKLPLPRWQKFVPVAYLVPFFLIPLLVLVLSPDGDQFQGKVRENASRPLSAMDQAILRDRPAGGRIAIWGWGAEYAVETQTPIGTRDAVSTFQIYPGPFRDYYRQRYLHDLKTNRPELFLEATGPHNFGFSDSKAYGIETFPELAKFISEQYRLDQTIDGMRLFLRSDLPPNQSGARAQADP